jgi:hypothetical protein
MQITGDDPDQDFCVIVLRLDRSAMRRWARDGEIGYAMPSDSVSERDRTYHSWLSGHVSRDLILDLVQAVLGPASHCGLPCKGERIYCAKGSVYTVQRGAYIPCKGERIYLLLCIGPLRRALLHVLLIVLSCFSIPHS